MRIGPVMNILSFDKQVSIISALVEGVSIRATERLTGVHRDTIMRLGLRVGFGCAAIHDALMREYRSWVPNRLCARGILAAPCIASRAVGQTQSFPPIANCIAA